MPASYDTAYALSTAVASCPILVALVAAVLLPLATINLFAWICSRGVTTDPALHWTERARRSYPFQVFLSGALLFVPLVHFIAATNYPSPALPIPKVLFVGLILVVSLLTANGVVTQWTHRYRRDAGTWLGNLKDFGIVLYIYCSTLLIMAVIAHFLPDHWNLRAGLVVVAIVLAFLWFNFGGWIRLGRILKVFSPADDELDALAASVAQRLGQPTPAMWIMNWNRANAFAVVLANSVCVTRKLREILSPAELDGVLAHEMAHISEDRLTRAMRLVLPLVIFMPLFTMGLWNTGNPGAGLLIWFVFFALGARLRQRLARKMEVRADMLATKAECAPGAYPAALAKLYEANGMPAVMRGKRKTHPHLYDRLIASGVTPDYPRPDPPGRWGSQASLALSAVNALCLAAIWFALF